MSNIGIPCQTSAFHVKHRHSMSNIGIPCQTSASQSSCVKHLQAVPNICVTGFFGGSAYWCQTSASWVRFLQPITTVSNICAPFSNICIMRSLNSWVSSAAQLILIAFGLAPTCKHFQREYESKLRSLFAFLLPLDHCSKVKADTKWNMFPLCCSHLRCLRPVAAYRSKAVYNNIMYMLAGHVAERLAGGRSWESLVKEEILEPLGMNSTTFFYENRGPGDGFSRQYSDRGRSRHPLDPQAYM